MRYFLLSIFLMVFSFSSAQEYFEGTITYEYQYKSLYSYITTEYIVKTFPSKSVFTFKGGKYTEELFYSNGNPPSKVLYDLETLKSYIIDSKSDTIWQASLDKIPGKLLKDEQTSLKKEVLGKVLPSYNLEYIVDDFNGKKVTNVYYFDNTLKLDPALYENYNQSYWNLYTKATQSIYLASSMSVEELYRRDATATKVEAKEILDSFFDLPEGKVIAERKM